MARDMYAERECASVKCTGTGRVGDRVEVLPHSGGGDLGGGANVLISSLHLDESVGNMKIGIDS